MNACRVKSQQMCFRHDLLLLKHFWLSEINTAELWRLAQVPNTFDFVGVVK